MGSAVALGPLLAPIVRRVGRRILGRLAGRIIASRSGQIIGTFLGPETLGVSILIGLAVDYGLNVVDEKLSRKNFIQEHRNALNDTRMGWERLARDQLSPLVRRWYADTGQAVVILGDRS